jgi:twitching motility protein PilT
MPVIDEYLKQVLEKKGSDLHFLAGDPPRIRLYGDLQPLRPERLEKEFVQNTLIEIMPKTALKRFEEHDGADFAYNMGEFGRFRVNVMRQLNGMGAVMRAIPSKALSMEQLNLPPAIYSLCRANNGLILVTGKTGSGKSTTLAAMIDDINSRMKGHILTIEDPIEFVHTRKQCLISQREVGVHTKGFAAALHSGLREDPDVVLVGELRALDFRIEREIGLTGQMRLGQGARLSVGRVAHLPLALQNGQLCGPRVVLRLHDRGPKTEDQSQAAQQEHQAGADHGFTSPGPRGSWLSAGGIARAATRRLAERERRFARTSARVALTGFLVSVRQRPARLPRAK